MAQRKGSKRVEVRDDEAVVPLQAVLLADSFAQKFRPITMERPKAGTRFIELTAWLYSLHQYWTRYAVWKLLIAIFAPLSFLSWGKAPLSCYFLTLLSQLQKLCLILINISFIFFNFHVSISTFLSTK